MLIPVLVSVVVVPLKALNIRKWIAFHPLSIYLEYTQCKYTFRTKSFIWFLLSWLTLSLSPEKLRLRVPYYRASSMFRVPLYLGDQEPNEASEEGIILWLGNMSGRSQRLVPDLLHEIFKISRVRDCPRGWFTLTPTKNCHTQEK